jgi:TonB-dependent receptor
MGRAAIRLLGGASALALTMVAGAAFAQTAGGQTEEPSSVDEVVITGVRGSLKEALTVKREADKVVEAISADDIGQMPNVTIAESIARLPGVNATRDRGNDSQAVVRGLGPRLVLGTINGREVATSEPDRNVRWEIYPSEVVSGVQVYKSQSADLIAGGVAATINISTVSPLDYRGPAFVVSAGPVYYDKGKDLPDYDPWGYRVSGSHVGTVGDSFGYALGVSAQKQKNGYASLQGWGYNDSTIRAGDNSGDLNGDGRLDATPWGAQTEVKRLDQDRLGLMGALEWRPSNDFTLKIDALYSVIDIQEGQDQTWFGANGVTGNWGNGNFGAYNGAGSSYVLVNDTVVAATLNNAFTSVTNVIAQYDEEKTLFVTGANAAWTLGAWDLKFDLAYSKAERENTWQAVLSEVYPATLSFDFRGKPSVSVSSNTADPTIQFAPGWRPGIHDGPETLEDELTSAAFDGSRALDGDFLTSVDFGVRFSDRTKSHRRLNWNQPPIGGGIALPAALLYAYEVDDLDVPALLGTRNFNALVDAAYGGFDRSLAFDNPLQRWEVQESDLEGYVKLDFKADWGVPVTGNVGVRLVHVENTSKGNQQVNNVVTPASVDHDYTEVLPSGSLNFELADDKILRLGLARVIARPPLDEMRVSRNLSDPLVPPLTGSDGNPRLDPFKATQFDVSYEWYFHDEALAAISAYYKDVDTHIGYLQENVTIGGDTYLITGPFNGDGGTIKGVELTFQTPFYFIPGMQDFGIYSNYAYVDSDIQEFSPIGNPLDATGLAKHTATVDVYYSSGPFEVRLGYKYHSPFTVIYGWNGADLQTLEEETTFDFSTAWQVNDRIGLRFQVNNLTDEELRIYRDNDPNRLGRYDTYGRRFLFDVTFKF